MAIVNKNRIAIEVGNKRTMPYISSIRNSATKTEIETLIEKKELPEWPLEEGLAWQNAPEDTQEIQEQ